MRVASEILFKILPALRVLTKTATVNDQKHVQAIHAALQSLSHKLEKTHSLYRTGQETAKRDEINMSDKKIETIEKRDPSSVAHLAASSGKPPSSSSGGHFIKAEEISFSKSGQWQLNKYGDGMTVSGSGSVSPDGGVLAQSDHAPQASSSAIKMYHIHDGAHQITKNPMHLEAITQRFGSTKNLESKGFRLIPVTAPMTKEEMEKQGMVNAPAPRTPPTIQGAGAASSVNRPLGKSD